MYEIHLTGTPRERGVIQGRAFAGQLVELAGQCPQWLGGISAQRVVEIRDRMVAALRRLYPSMVIELEGIAEGSGLSFDQVCTINFVSAIGALGGCTNLVQLETGRGPVLAKTSDIGEDYRYYCLQHVRPDQGYEYFAISWAGNLWAEVGINGPGLAVGQSSAPTMPGQSGDGVPTLEYPRLLLESCANVAEAIRFCQEYPMAGKGLNIAMVDPSGDGAIVEKSGTRCAVRRPQQQGGNSSRGAVHGAVYCANIFLSKEMQAMIPLAIPGLPSITTNSEQRLANLDRFFATHPRPEVEDLASLMKTRLEEGGLCQSVFPELTTHYAYLLFPAERSFWLLEGMATGEEKRMVYSL